MKISYSCGRFAGAVLLATTLHSLASDQIQSYTVPKEHPPLQLAQPLPAAGAPDIPVNSAPIRWTVPAGWEEKPASGIRRGSFDIKGEKAGKAEVVITSFPGEVGGVLANVNRWRSELALAPVEAGDLASEPVTVDSFQGKLFDIAGASARTVVALIPRNGDSWFIKLRGDTAIVATAKPAFLEFLKSIHFGADGGNASPAASTAPAPAPADPHAGLGLQGVPNPHGEIVTGEPATEAPTWNVPAQWVESAPRAMIFKTFSVSGDAGAKAEITVSFFPGEVGGVLNNVNRWRAQMGQPPIEQSQLDGATESLATADGTATLVDFMGTDAKTSQPARLVAAIVPHGGKTWFYKLMGNGKVVDGQKDSFVQFVKTVHYP
jgi:hypothetical protein